MTLTHQLHSYIWLLHVVFVVLVCTSCLTPGDGLIGDPVDPGSQVEIRSDYPVGPYGQEMGNIIDNLQFTQADGNPMSLGDIHDDYSNRLLLLSVYNIDCASCLAQQDTLEQIHQEFQARGLQSLLILMGSSSEDSSKVDEFVKTLQESSTFSVVSPQTLDHEIYQRESIKTHPLYLLIDVQTMKIVNIQDTMGVDIFTESIDQRLPQMIKSSDYPAAPYGVEEGKIIKNLSFTAIDGGTFTLDDIYQDHSKRLLLLTTSAEWCTACVKEQPELEKFYQEYAAQGLDILVIMFQDANFEPATTTVAANWKRRYSLSFHVVADERNPSTMSPYYDINLTPMVMLVDLEEMKMIYISQGFDKDTVLSYFKSYF